MINRVLFGAYLLFLVALVFLVTNVLGAFPGGFVAEEYYQRVAENILRFGVHSDAVVGDSVAPPGSSFRPPLYPIVLAVLFWLFGSEPVVGALFGACIYAVSVPLAFWAFLSISRVAAMGAAIVMALDPIYWVHSVSSQSDALFLALVLLASGFSLRFVRRPSLKLVLALATFLALATLTRAAMVYYWIPLFAVIWFLVQSTEGKRIASGYVLAFLGVQLILVGGWTLRNAVVADDAHFASMRSAHLMSFSAPEVLAQRDGISFVEARRILNEQLAETPGFGSLEGAAKRSAQSSFATRFMLANPVALVQNVVGNAISMYLSFPWEGPSAFLGPSRLKQAIAYSSTWSGRFRSLDERLRGLREAAQAGMVFPIVYGFLSKATNALLVVLGLAGALMMVFERGERRRMAIVMILFIVYLTAVSSVSTQGRFRIPLMPGVGALAFFAIEWVFLVFRRRRRTQE